MSEHADDFAWAAMKKVRQHTIEECARVCDESATKVRAMLDRELKRAANPIPGDIRDHDNGAAGLDGMLAGITDMATAIRALKTSAPQKEPAG